MENKQEICNLLLKAVQATRAGKDIIALDYHNDKEAGIETVTMRFKNGYAKTQDVTCDSGCALIRDIMKGVN